MSILTWRLNNIMEGASPGKKDPGLSRHQSKGTAQYIIIVELSTWIGQSPFSFSQWQKGLVALSCVPNTKACFIVSSHQRHNVLSGAVMSWCHMTYWCHFWVLPGGQGWLPFQEPPQEKEWGPEASSVLLVAQDSHFRVLLGRSNACCSDFVPPFLLLQSRGSPLKEEEQGR